MVMETAISGYELIRRMIDTGNPGSVTDAAVGALAITSGIRGAYLNIRINVVQINDRNFADDLLEKGAAIESKAIAEEEQ